MKVTAHLKIAPDGKAYAAMPYPQMMEESCEEHNREYLGPGYLSRDKQFAAVTVEFEVPDNIFKRAPLPVFKANPV